MFILPTRFTRLKTFSYWLHFSNPVAFYFCALKVANWCMLSLVSPTSPLLHQAFLRWTISHPVTSLLAVATANTNWFVFSLPIYFLTFSSSPWFASLYGFLSLCLCLCVCLSPLSHLCTVLPLLCLCCLVSLQVSVVKRRWCNWDPTYSATPETANLFS